MFIDYKHMIQECVDIFVGLIDFIFKGKSLLEYRNLFSTNEYKKLRKQY